MNSITITCDCSRCENNEYCPDYIQGRTKEVMNSIEIQNIPVEFINKSLLPWINIVKTCALNDETTVLDNIQERAPLVNWFSCTYCKKNNLCSKKIDTLSWINKNTDNLNKFLIEAPISAPWIDSKIICKLDPRNK